MIKISINLTITNIVQDLLELDILFHDFWNLDL